MKSSLRIRFTSAQPGHEGRVESNEFWLCTDASLAGHVAGQSSHVNACSAELMLAEDAAAVGFLQLGRHTGTRHLMTQCMASRGATRLFVLGVAVWVSCLGVYQFADDPSQAEAVARKIAFFGPLDPGRCSSTQTRSARQSHRTDAIRHWQRLQGMHSIGFSALLATRIHSSRCPHHFSSLLVRWSIVRPSTRSRNVPRSIAASSGSSSLSPIFHLFTWSRSL